jgi:hypothetical protein
MNAARTAHAVQTPAQRPTPARFLVSGVRPTGEAFNWHRTGGASIDHALEAQDAVGLGGVVRVVPMHTEVPA